MNKIFKLSIENDKLYSVINKFNNNNEFIYIYIYIYSAFVYTNIWGVLIVIRSWWMNRIMWFWIKQLILNWIHNYNSTHLNILVYVVGNITLTVV